MTDNSKIPTLNAWLQASIQQLQAAAFDSARLDSELLACAVLNKPRTWLHAHSEHELSAVEQDELNTLLQRRLNHESIAYIIGEKEFYGRTFSVNSSVLVPRPESEDFITVIKTLPKNLTYIDIGTGTGILAITTALEQPTWSGTATDISPEALKVAQANATKRGAENLVFKVQNLVVDDPQKYDLFLANLPYVPTNLRNKADISHEPEIALFADHHGLALYEALFQQIRGRQHKPTHVLTESLLDQHRSLKKMAEEAGYNLKDTEGLIQHFVRG
jgi:release factor glutamine methyltransferase